jgi:Protein of unknown function DUF262
VTTQSSSTPTAVEVRPEVVFLSELLEELTKGQLRIPRFQRPFVWRRDQMTDLLDSVYKQYPIGSLLVWETDLEVSTLDQLGPFNFPGATAGRVGYLLDGHQRLATLAGALVPHKARGGSKNEEDPARWDLSWNMESSRFQHGRAENDPSTLFPLTALLDTILFLEAVDKTREALRGQPELAERYTSGVSILARSFQHYRIPVVRIRQTGLSEAVEIFARLNSKGQAMSADQMVGALMYRQGGPRSNFDLASEIDRIEDQLAERSFGDVDRTTILRCILANIDEDIYRTDWTRLTSERRDVLLPKLREGCSRTSRSIDAAIDFLEDCGVHTSRLLPYMMQLVLLSSFFDRRRRPSAEQRNFLRKWFWVSSFATWFGGANTSRVSSLVTEFRQAAAKDVAPERLEYFDMNARSLPFPAAFDMRSARTRSLLLVMLSLSPKYPDGTEVVDPWRGIAEMGPGGVGYIFGDPPRDYVGSPANRIIRPPDVLRGALNSWIRRYLAHSDESILRSHGLNRAVLGRLLGGDVGGAIQAREKFLVDLEREFQASVGVLSSKEAVGNAPVDTD